jgi:hypothetical protein
MVCKRASLPILDVRRQAIERYFGNGLGPLPKVVRMYRRTQAGFRPNGSLTPSECD